MNNLSKLLAQLRAIWGQLGPSQRVSVVAATFVLVAGSGALVFWSSRADYSLLYGGLSDSEAAKVVSALDDAKVPYKASAGSIFVPADKVYAMRMQLAGRGIPQGDGVGFEIFDKPNFGISDFVQRANYIRAVQGELARTISQIDEVEAARVMIVEPENRLLLDKDKYPTASVFVHVRGNSQLQPQSINAIRFLVANSVEGLKPNHVTVVDNLGNVLSENTDDDSITGLTGTQLAARRNLEQYLAKKAQDMLEKVVGPGQAIVRVSADINYDTSTSTQEKFDPDGQVIRTQTKNDESNDSTTSNSAAPVGIAANTATSTNSTPIAAAPVNNTENRKVTTTVEYEIGKTTSSVVQAAGAIKRLSAAVTVAAQMEGTGTDRKVVSRSPEELQKLQGVVASALGIDKTRGDSLTLEELPFNDQFATEVTQELDQQQQREFWWNLARNLTFPALGLLAFVVLLRLLKRTPVQEIPIGVPVSRLIPRYNGNGNGNGNGHPIRPGEFEIPGVVTVDVLNRLIKENPTNMTQAIRDWMNRGRTPER
ncbi:MAG TPA: flagellar basal-body MS-ring/collar protein FliF [Candidatus Sulfopaludibacter sp.]|nr:flagellar basal-body MS-ring/collar protein FliF [Candidatus Sulfopaludibacter sp.]